MRRFTFPKRLQLRSRVDYNRVFSRCVRSSDDFFTVLARRNELQHARLGTVVSRRSAGNAVRRHRLKRLIREAFRAAQHELPAVDLVVLSRHGVSEQSNASLAASLHAHWRRIGSKCAH